MAEDELVAEEEQNGSVYTETGAVRQDFLTTVSTAIENQDDERLRVEFGRLHSSEIGDVIEAMPPDQRIALVGQMGSDFDFAALTEVDEAIRLEIVDQLPNDQIALAVQELDSDDAVYILEDLEEEDQEEILASAALHRTNQAASFARLSGGDRRPPHGDRIRRRAAVLDGRADHRLHARRQGPAGEVQPDLRHRSGLPALGAVDLDRVLRTQRAEKVESVMHETRHAIPVAMDQEEAAQVFERYDLLSAAVVDENDRLVGVLTIDDVVDVIQEEAEEDIKALGGVGDEELSDTTVEIARSRFIWLLMNLATAVLASAVIGLFDGTIQQMVALAVLMPIVASMGGNAGTQTMTVAVRALATRDIDIYNAARIIRRETLVGLLNGVMFAVLIGLLAAFWFDSPSLGGVIAAAMVINMLAAALAGILIPLRAGQDGRRSGHRIRCLRHHRHGCRRLLRLSRPRGLVVPSFLKGFGPRPTIKLTFT